MEPGKEESSTLRQRKQSTSSLAQSSSDSETVQINGKKVKKERPPGSRSRWSTSSKIERLFWILIVPFRALLCFSNVTVFFLTYFGFMITVLWAKKLWPRFYWFYEGKLYMVSNLFIGIFNIICLVVARIYCLLGLLCW